MKYINELREGENIIEHYLCKSRQTMKSRNGKNYLSLKLQDKTGMVDAKVWDLNNDISELSGKRLYQSRCFCHHIQQRTAAECQTHPPQPRRGIRSCGFCTQHRQKHR